ncbi:pseudouridine synthase [Barrientosiimonas marina]|uniref:Pseudouridine synthase n=1 Tax=Lentibacillus kimchii TaxID=1542911 RepID=A0ABW2UYA4_9BACI
MRLDKLLANTGYGSRKDVKTLIKKKHVSVNGQLVRSSDLQVHPDYDRVLVDQEEVHYQDYIYIMLNKPSGFISATADGQTMTVVDLLTADYQRFKPFPVGRLDKDTQGLLLMTNDGELGHQLTSPKKAVEKVYYAQIDGHVTDDDVSQFRRGIELDDGYMTKPAVLEIIEAGDLSEVYITVTEGKFHQVKRMVEGLGKKVMFLERIRMGTLTLDNQLQPGEYRELTEAEELSLQPAEQKKR